MREPDYVAGWKRLLAEEARGSYGELVADPGYEGRLGFLYLVQTDMQRVLDLVATEQRPVVVFVDDLDRCSPSTVAQVIEAINLFLAGQFPNCVFVIAMEPEMVAAHIEVAYQSLEERLRTSDYWGETGMLGWRFLDKIVQLPLSLPTLDPERASRFTGAVLVGRSQPLEPDDPGGDDAGEERAVQLEQAIRQEATSIEDIPEAAARVQADVLGEDVAAGELSPEARSAARRALRQRLRDDDPEVRAIVEAVAPWLHRNPREIKRFVNVFRFYVLIRQGRQEAGLPVPDSLEQVAKLAVLAVRWPQLRGVLGRQIGPEDGDSLLALLEAPWMNCPPTLLGRCTRKPLPRSSPTLRFHRSCNRTCLSARISASVSLTVHRSVPQRAGSFSYRQQVRPDQLEDQAAESLMDITALQSHLREFAQARDWEQFHTPKNLAMALAAEAGELLEIFQWLTDEQAEAITTSDADLQMVCDELADIFIYLLRMADVLQVDMEDAVQGKLRSNERKYPVDLAKGNATKYSRRS